HSSATSAIRTSTCLPTMTRSTLAMTRSADSLTLFTAGTPLRSAIGRDRLRRTIPQPAAGWFTELGSSGASGSQLQPLRHDRATDRRGVPGAGAASLHHDRDRDRGEGPGLGRRKADEPRVRLQARTTLGGPGLARGLDPRDAEPGDVPRARVLLPDRSGDRVDHDL